MTRNAFIIVALLVTLIAAPVVDAIACENCKDIVPLQNMTQRVSKGIDRSECSVSLSDACAADSQRTATAPDLCPVCSSTAVPLDNAYYVAPSLISETNHLPKLLAFSDPSYSITKPPEN